MPDAGSRLRFRGLWIGVDRKVRIGHLQVEAITFEIRRTARKPRVQQTSLRQRVKVSISTARRFQPLLRGGDRSQRLNRRSFIGGAQRFRIDTQTLRRVARKLPFSRLLVSHRVLLRAADVQWQLSNNKWKMAFKVLAHCLFSLCIIAAPGARNQIGAPDQLHGHRPPRTVPHAIRRAIA